MTSNEALFKKSKTVIPSGVNSPVRAFGAVGGIPRFIKKGKGPIIWDIEGSAYIDYICSWGPLILGHSHSLVLDAISAAMSEGTTFGAPTEKEWKMAELLTSFFGSIDKVRLVSSGTEATMSAIRLARGFTSRDKILKFEGCYHGHVDALLVKSGSGALTFGTPSSAGIPKETTANSMVARYGDSDSLNHIFGEYGDELAAVIIEPIAGNMNLIVPDVAYLKLLRKLCSKHGVVLIFDEVMTGFRVGLEGAQGLFGVEPDLTTLGKVIGGGLPMGAFGGREDIMDELSPEGPVYQAGTLSGNPIAVAAGLATLREVKRRGFFDEISLFTDTLVTELRKAALELGVAFCAQSVGSMFGIYFSEEIPKTYQDVIKSDNEKFKIFFGEMLRQGVYFAPSPFEAGFTSIMHKQKEIDKTISAAQVAFRKMQVS